MSLQRAARTLSATLLCVLSFRVQLKSFEVIGPRWSGATVGFRINGNFPDTALSGSPEKQIETILCAAAAWRDQSRSRFQFVYQGTTAKTTFNQNDGVNIVAYSTADGGDALAATLVDGEGNNATSFDVLFFDKTNGTKNRWSGNGEPQAGELDIGGVATHELGHGLGLSHSPISQATMFASASGRAIGLRTLHQDDRDGVEFLYGTRTLTAPAVEITAVQPPEGATAGGNEVVIEGGNFTYKADTQIRLGGTLLSAAKFIIEDCSTIRILEMPPHGSSSVAIEITNAVGTIALSDGYRYVGPSATILSVSPSEGPTEGGVPIAVTGENLTPDAIITIGGAPLEDQQVISPTRVEGKVPAALAGGAVDVRLEQGDDVSVLPGAFTYNPFALRLADVEASPGQSGVIVTARATSPVELGSVSFGLVYDSGSLAVESATTAGTAAEAAEFVGANVQNATGVTTVEIIADLDGSELTIPLGTNLAIVKLLVGVAASASVDSRIALALASDVGVPPVQLAFTESGNATKLSPLTTDGSIRVVAGITFLRGDVNDDVRRDISDPVFLLDFLFKGGPGGVCEDASDANDDGVVDISDAVSLLGFLFQGNPSLPPPFPGPGPDPTADALGCR